MNSSQSNASLGAVPKRLSYSRTLTSESFNSAEGSEEDTPLNSTVKSQHSKKSELTVKNNVKAENRSPKNKGHGHSAEEAAIKADLKKTIKELQEVIAKLKEESKLKKKFEDFFEQQLKAFDCYKMSTKRKSSKKNRKSRRDETSDDESSCSCGDCGGDSSSCSCSDCNDCSDCSDSSACSCCSTTSDSDSGYLRRLKVKKESKSSKDKKNSNKNKNSHKKMTSSKSAGRKSSTNKR